jgi:hypothetical protein
VIAFPGSDEKKPPAESLLGRFLFSACVHPPVSVFFRKRDIHRIDGIGVVFAQNTFSIAVDTRAVTDNLFSESIRYVAEANVYRQIVLVGDFGARNARIRFFWEKQDRENESLFHEDLLVGVIEGEGG